MEVQHSNPPKKLPLASTKLDFGYTFPRGGIQYKSEGFSFEENRKLLKLLVTRARIRLYTICATLLVALLVFMGKNGFILLKELLWPP